MTYSIGQVAEMFDLPISTLRYYDKEGLFPSLQRKELFERRLDALEEEMTRLSRMRDMLKYKCWYYDTALADGGEERIQAMLPDSLPPDVQKLYDSGFRS